MNIKEGFIKIPKNAKNQFVIFGTGDVADSLIKEIEKIYDSTKIAYFIDSSRKEKTFKGKEVYCLDDITKELIANNTFIVASYTKSIIMKKLLLEIGVNETNIIAAKNYFDYKSLQYGSKKINTILIYPCVTSEEILYELLEDIDWFLLSENQETPQILIPIQEGLEPDRAVKRKNVTLCKENEITSKKADVIFVYSSQYLTNINIHTEVYCFDNEVIERINFHMWLALSYRLLKAEVKAKYSQLSKANFSRLKDLGAYKKGAAIGTGPSLEIGLDKMDKIGMDKFLKIVCNRTATSKEIIDRIKPEAYTILSTYTIEKKNCNSLKIVVDYIENNNCILIVPNYFLSIILKLTNTENIILVNVDSPKICFPDEDNITICREMSGVMTGMVLPFLSAFCKEIYILGCDGKKVEENEKGLVKELEEHPKFDFYWSGSEEYSQLESLILLMEQHKDIFEYGEKKGTIYKSITHSYNSHLEERYFECT